MSRHLAPARRPAALLVCLLVAALAPLPLGAQQQTGFDSSRQWRIEQLAKNHVKLIGDVEARRGDMTFQADTIESFTDTHRVVAIGNVVFTQGDNWIAADRVEFNTETRLGTFFSATGSISVASDSKRSMLGGQEPDVLFYGEKVEKAGPSKYRITKGAFTTCLQPTPRWEVSAGTLVLNLDRYAYLRGAVLRAKGLPVLYLPFLYYPINDEDRATGFLMPSYGTSTYRGFTLSNAFFWAINRSHDATLLHDWFTSRGQGMGAEYRYAGTAGAGGNARFYTLRERESALTSGGVTSLLPKRTSYQLAANLTQPLGGTWTARGRVDYFSDITVQQTYHTDIYDASRSQRTITGGVGGTLGTFTINGNYTRSEYFANRSETTLVGGTPQVQFSRGEQPIPRTPLYFGLSGEVAHLQREYRRDDLVSDSNLSRLDISPTLRFPFTRLRWLTVNSSVALRETWWSRSRVAGTNDLVDEGIARRYMQFSSRVVGPVVNRVWNTPGNGYAERFKHTIEPYVDLQRVTAVDNFELIVQNDGTDSIIGGTTRINYGLTNRFLAKRRESASPREFINLGISQTYYTDARASQYDYNYSTSFSGLPPTNFSPISIASRLSPTDQINGSLRMEYDYQARAIRSLSAAGQVAASDWLSVVGGYSQRRVLDYTQRQDQGPRYRQENSVNAATTLRGPGNRLGGSYTFNYDITRSTMLGSRVVGYYNAQCCGFAVEYQTVSFPQFNPAFPVKRDNRFNFTFTLAGLGTFSNFFGAFGGGGAR
ncbi:MAG TPA: putative LPS assembly protein LptD [Vicinamibacterales bacterium]|nr:putative LPS assembly protein LptD [Vicinamibacterales bacterium]